MALGPAIHLADALPDTAADSAVGARGLTQALGRWALLTCWLLLVAANALLIALAILDLTPVRPLALLIAEPLALGALLAAVINGRPDGRSERQRLRVNFLLTIFIALVTAIGWLASAVL